MSLNNCSLKENQQRAMHAEKAKFSSVPKCDPVELNLAKPDCCSILGAPQALQSLVETGQERMRESAALGFDSTHKTRP